MMQSKIGRAHDRLNAAVRDFIVSFALAVALLAWVISQDWPSETRTLRWQVLEARGWSHVSTSTPLLFSSTHPKAGDVLARARIIDPGAGPAGSAMLAIASIGGLVFAIVFTIVLRGRSSGVERHLRGARIVHPTELRARLVLDRIRERILGRGPNRPPIVIGGIPVPHHVEPLHFLVNGSTGVGKSHLIRSVLRTIRERGECAIVADIGGDLMAAHAANGDKLLNPLDTRSASWSPFAEMRAATDADRIAQSMIPVGEGESAEWHRYSQALIAAVIERLYLRGEATNERLLYYLTIAKSEEIEHLVARLPAQTLFDTGAAKMLSSVRGIIGGYLPAYRFLNPEAGKDWFSLSGWVASAGSGWLWMPYLDRDAAAIRPLLATWIGELVSAVLSLRPDPTRRIWLVLDELATLGLVGSLTDALTKGRKFGLCAVLGLQSISQLRAAYGRDGATTLLSCLRNSVIFAVDDAETADAMSRRLGDAELEREDQTISDHGKSSSTRRSTSRIVLPSEVMTQPNLTAFLKLAGDYPVTRVHVPVVPAPEVVEPFCPRDVPRGTSAP